MNQEVPISGLLAPRPAPQPQPPALKLVLPAAKEEFHQQVTQGSAFDVNLRF